MELADLLIFRTVVEAGGIVKAARRLHRVQSSITSRIQQLEASVGTPLFHRSKQRLHLSAAGEMLLGYADRLLRLSEEARVAVTGSPPHGVLRLGALESTTASRLPDVLAAYHREFPAVRVELTTGTNDALVAALASRRVDAAFVAEAPVAASFASMPLFEERLVVIASTAHRPITRPRDVEGDTVIAFPNGCAYRRVLQRWLGARAIAGLRVLELGSYHAIVACVASGTGIALVPHSVLTTVRHRRVSSYPLPKIHGHVVTPLAWRTGESSPAVTALREMLDRRLRKREAVPNGRCKGG